jgi:hypothetical protein
MSRYAWPVTVLGAVVIAAVAAIVIVLIVHRGPAATPVAAASSAAARTATASASATPPATVSATPAAVAADVTVCVSPVVSCSGQMRTEPAQVLVSADGSGYVHDLTWSGWGGATARGAGTLEVDNCSPNCAQGTYTGYPATVTLSRLTPYGSGRRAYADMVISVPAAPAGVGPFSYKHLVP